MMKQELFFVTVTLFILCLGCNTNNINGVYICDQSHKLPDTTIHHENSVESFMDLTCTIQELNLKGNSTVELKMSNGPIVTSYVKDKDYIRVNGTGSDILFKIEDNKTLSGEGIAKGFYHKK